MRALHTLRYRKPLADFEILTMALSALEWRRYNGKITLATDSMGLDFIEKHGLTGLWDDVELSLDDWAKLNINESVFWAGAKIFALFHQQAPCVMMDLDFIVWQTLNFNHLIGDLAVIHREDVNNETYPAADFFRFKQGYTMNADWNWSEPACNTAFAYFGSERLKQDYCRQSIEFMKNAAVAEDYLHYMVFAEQRLLAMCAAQQHVAIKTFSDLPQLFGSQECFTHLWGYKETLRQDRAKADDYCRKCLRRLQHDFPEWADEYMKAVHI